MITRLIIKNFQAHKKLVVKLDPHITTVVGSSDVGKSSIIRALRWLCLNQPQGESFLRSGSTKVEVVLHIDDHKIIRRRGKGTKNAYVLDRKRLTAFGRKVPREVEKILQVDELNFQGQHDSPFWFGKSEMEVSRELNSIVDLEVIDTTLKNLATNLRRRKTERNLVEDRVEKAKEEKISLKWTWEADRDLKEVERLEEEWESVAADREILEGLLEEAKQAQSKLKQFKGISQAMKDLSALERLGGALRKAEVKKHRLRTAIIEVKQKGTTLFLLSKKVKDIQKQLEEFVGETCPLCGQSIEEN